MQNLRGSTVILTGASRGIGTYIAHALASAGMNLVLAARSERELEEIAASLRQRGGRVVIMPTDITTQSARCSLIETAQREFGAVDLLVNNAAYLTVQAFAKLELCEIERVIEVNLIAPMLLSRMVLPGMLERRRGHIVNISSIAGKVAAAYLEPYAASKAGLNCFTSALRLSYRGTGVSASVISPGFVSGAGMYEKLRADTGMSSPRLAGTVAAEKVAQAVIRAVQRDLPEVTVNPSPVWPLVVLQAVTPRLFERVAPRLIGGFYRRAGQMYEERILQDSPSTPE